MKATFIETVGFTETISDFLSDDVYARLQHLLMADPEAGDVMKGCGGMRKIRIADPKRGKGKRGGARVVYLQIPEARRIHMVDVYGKDEKDDLSPAEKKQLRLLAEQVKREAIAAYQRWLKENE